MPRDVPVGNGSLLVAFDREGLIREFHFPHVGEENHAGEPFRLAIAVDGTTHLLSSFEIQRDYLGETLVSQLEWKNESLGLKITSNDTVDFEKNIYLKKFVVENLFDNQRECKLFCSQSFYIYSNPIGDTAAFKPDDKLLLHYKHERYFSINISANHKYGIDEFATGNLGTWKDAEDGVLSGNPIAQGAVDSSLAIPLTLEPKGKTSCIYWICAGKTWEEVQALDTFVKKTTPEVLLQRTDAYWRSWVNKEPLDHLPPSLQRLYKRSALICATQINRCGSVIAANDSDAIGFNRDTYSYMWPRDGALVAHAMELAGYNMESFFQFTASLIQKEGYFLHKYLPSGSLGSSWHPWLKDGASQLPIQEDETALVIWALWKHFEKFKDLERIAPLYHPLIKKAADFMMNYRDPRTNLPLPSYDLWEERQGILTFTLSTVYGGLMAASHFAALFGDMEVSQEYKQGALDLKQAMDKYLYLPHEKRFARMINFSSDGKIEVDSTLDASLYGLFAFGAYSVDDPKVKSTMDQVFTKLVVNGGTIRYENDPYYREGALSNPWFVTTLWRAQYLIAKGDLQEALKVLEWVAEHALPSGVLAEQISAQNGQPLSVSPLTWSHGTLITTIQHYWR
jgi:glucoamylase